MTVFTDELLLLGHQILVFISDEKRVFLSDQKIFFISIRRESNNLKGAFIDHQMEFFTDEQRVAIKVEKRGVQRQEKEVLETSTWRCTCVQ